MMAFFITAIVRFISGASVQWVGCEPVNRPRIYFANHTSNLDGVVLWAALPPEVRAKTRLVAAHDYWTANSIRRYMAANVFHAVLIERKKVTVHNNPLNALLPALAEGASLIIFPEGRRGDASEPGTFKSGLYHLASKRPEIELVPVYIDNMNRILPKGEFLAVPLLSCLRFGTPLHLGEHEPKEAFMARAYEAVRALKPE